MTEQRFSRLQQAVDATVQARKSEQSAEHKRRDENRKKLNAVIAEYKYLMSSPVVDAFREAGLVLRKASKSEIMIYATENPEPKDPNRWEYFHTNPNKRLSYKPQLALIWDIQTEDIRGLPLENMTWKEITATVWKDEQTCQFRGFVIESSRGIVPTGDLPHEIFDGVDIAASSPFQNLGDMHKNDYERFRVKFQVLGRSSQAWREVEPEFRPKQPERYLVR